MPPKQGYIMCGYVGRRELIFTDWMLSLLKNHLIETASASTGSLIIWDTGEYEVLPYREDIEQVTDDELSNDSDGNSSPSSSLSDSEKLHQGFRNVGASFSHPKFKSTKPGAAQDKDSPPRNAFATWLHCFHASPEVRKPP